MFSLASCLRLNRISPTSSRAMLLSVRLARTSSSRPSPTSMSRRPPNRAMRETLGAELLSPMTRLRLRHPVVDGVPMLRSSKSHPVQAGEVRLSLPLSLRLMAGVLPLLLTSPLSLAVGKGAADASSRAQSFELTNASAGGLKSRRWFYSLTGVGSGTDDCDLEDLSRI